MFAEALARVRFDQGRPAQQLLYDTQDFRVLLLGLRPGQEIPLHTTTSSVLLQIVSGSGQVQIGEEVRAVSAGAVAVCPPYHPHSLTAGDEDMTVLAVIAPSP